MSPTPTSEPPRVVINEVAWAGTKANDSDEWIELYNAGGNTIDLSGWILKSADGAPIIILPSGASIAPNSYFLIERTDDNTVSDISADFAGSFGKSGSLENIGENLQLFDAQENIIDAINCTSGWFAGSASPDYFTMERIDPLGSGDNSSNWATNTGLITTGQDIAGNLIKGTPKYKNSVSP